jgi:DNA-binding Lrp family transcriptional regulator
MRCIAIPVLVFLTVNAERGHTEEIMSRLIQCSEVTECYAIADGIYDVVALIKVKDFDEYLTFALDKVGNMKHIDNYTSFITTGE